MPDKPRDYYTEAEMQAFVTRRWSRIAIAAAVVALAAAIVAIVA